MKWMECLLLVTMAFLPPLLYAIWIRNTEKYHREKWIPIFVCFLWGATIAVMASILLEFLLEVPLAVSIQDISTITFFTIVFIAPVVEEFTKPLALRLKTVVRQLDEPEDGLIYGAVAGLGFSATENLFYGMNFLAQGLFVFFLFMVLRSFGGCLLHASATAWTGYGYGKSILRKTSLLRIIPYFIIAICMHSFYNFLVSYNLSGIATGLLAALLFVAVTMSLVRKKIQQLDLKS